MKCLDCGCIFEKDESGIDGYCTHCFSENIKEYDEDFNYAKFHGDIDHSELEPRDCFGSMAGRNE